MAGQSRSDGANALEHAIGADTVAELDEGEQRRHTVIDRGSADRELLLRSLGDTDWRVRRSAARLAGDSDGAVTSNDLVCLLDSEDAGVRNAAMKALIRMGPRALEALHASLGHEHADVRNFSAVCLGNIGETVSVGELTDALETEPDANVRYMIVEALGRIGDASACMPLERLLDDDPMVAAAAITALADIGSLSAVDRLILMLDDPYLGGVAAAALCRLADGRALPALVRRVSRSSAGAQVFLSALAYTLEQMNSRMPDMLSLMRSLVDSEDQEALVNTLRPGLLSSDPETVPRALGVSLWLSDTRLAHETLTAYGTLGNWTYAAAPPPTTEFSVALLEAIASGTPYLGRQAFLEELAERPRPGTAQTLLTVAERCEPSVAAVALRALAAASESVPCNRILSFWDHPDEEIRVEAARTLGRLSPPGATRAIVEAAHSTDSKRARLAAVALASRRRSSRSSNLWAAADSLSRHPDQDIRAEIARALSAGSKTSTMSSLAVRLSHDASPKVRRAIAGTLGHRRDPGARVLLRQLSRDDDPGVRQAAIIALGCDWADREDAEIIVGAMRDPNPRVAIAAAQAMGACTRLLSAPGSLADLTHSEDPDIAVEALNSLSKLDPRLGAQVVEEMRGEPQPWRLRAAMLLAKSKQSSEHALACAASALDDADPSVRAVAIEIVTAHCDARDGQALLLTLIGDERLREATLHALAERAPLVLGALKLISKTTDGVESVDAVHVLGASLGPESAATIREMLASERSSVRWRGLVGVSSAGITEFEPDLRNFVASETDPTLESVAYALLDDAAGEPHEPV